MKRNVSETNDAVVRHSSLLQDLYQPDTAADSETLVHRMQPHDTLSGICVKYGALPCPGESGGGEKELREADAYTCVCAFVLSCGVGDGVGHEIRLKD